MPGALIGKKITRPGPGPGKLGPGPARSPQKYYLPARARPGPASFRPAPGPAAKYHRNLARPGPWAAGWPGPRAQARSVQDPSRRTFFNTTMQYIYVKTNI